MKLMLMCQEVTRLISSGEIERKGPFTRLLVKMHFSLCKCCPHYIQTLKNTISLYRQKFSQPANPEQVKQVADRITQRLLQQS